MWTKQLAAAALIVGASGTANAYETGQLTCQNVGQLAAQMIMAKQSGIAPQTYLSALYEKLPPEAQIERELAVELAAFVYSDEQVSAMPPEQAYAAFTQNCIASKEQDQTTGQQEQDSTLPDDSTGMQEDDNTSGQNNSPEDDNSGVQ